MIWSNYNRTDISSEKSYRDLYDFFSGNGRKSPYKFGDMRLKRINNYLLREQISFIIRRDMMGGG